jgi:hypothetical protein
MRNPKPLLSTIAAAAAGLLLSSAPALATNYGYKQAGVFGANGTAIESTPFLYPYGVAVDNDPASPSYQDVYVADGVLFGAQTVGKFTPSGEPISMLTLPEGANPGSIAVDPSSGDVYVVNLANTTVDKFTATGEPVSGFELTGVTFSTIEAVTVAPSGGDVYIADAGKEAVYQFSESGALLSEIGYALRGTGVGLFQVSDVGVDPEGNVYATASGGTSGTSGVDKYSVVEGAWKFDGVVDRGQIEVGRLAVDPVTGTVYTTGGVEGGHIQSHYDDLEWHGPSGALLYEFGSSNGFGELSNGSSGVAVDAATGTVYVSYDKGHRVVIFERVPLAAPSATGLPASRLFAQSAVLNASLDPNGLDTQYHFEYWTTTNPQHIHSPTIDAGAGFATQPVYGVINGIEANTTYHAELVATNSEGTSTGEEQTFTTPALPAPEASTSAASEITPYSARIAGTLNANGIVTSYHFDIGSDTNYGAQVFGSGIFAEATPITLGLQNLQPGTTYHYRFVASNLAGTVYGQDESFTTATVLQAITAAYIPPLIAIPNINFPGEEKGDRTRTKVLTRVQKLAKALKACTKQPKKKRAACRKQARRKYGKVKKRTKG